MEKEKNTNDVPNDFNRNYFPDDFVFGTASSAFQYEGEAHTKGRGLCIWDTFSHDFPEKIADGSNGDEAIDFYNRYKDDVQLMKELKLDAFRFSISWSRILPSGSLSGGVNKEGIDFYNNLINELKAKGLEPYVTLFHWDTPLALEDEYNGFLSSNIVNDFEDYANLCFKIFGDRVKYWITFNEPWSFAHNGYETGEHAPGRCSSWAGKPCKEGNSATEPYVVAHNILLSHGVAVKIYREKYKDQNGKIGITLVCNWMEPYSNSVVDQDAARRSLDFFLGWFFHPLVHGDYPVSMREIVGDRLPSFTEEEILMLKGSFDFLGLNYYTATFAVNVEKADPNYARYSTDCHAKWLNEKDGVPIGPRAASTWLYIYPKGIRSLLKHIKESYNNPVIYITENGMDEFNDGTLELEKSINDPVRERYFKDHLWNVYKAMKEDKVIVKGYFAWSLLDNFEWQGGYTLRFGLYYIDFKDDLRRHPKNSVKWFKQFLGSDMMD